MKHMFASLKEASYSLYRQSQGLISSLMTAVLATSVLMTSIPQFALAAPTTGNTASSSNGRTANPDEVLNAIPGEIREFRIAALSLKKKKDRGDVNASRPLTQNEINTRDKDRHKRRVGPTHQEVAEEENKGTVYLAVRDRGESLLAKISSELSRLENTFPRPVDYEDRKATLISYWTQVSEISGEYSLPFIMAKDPGKPLDQKNSLNGEVKVYFADPDAVVDELPSQLKKKFHEAAAGAVINTSGQFLMFSVLNTMFSMSQLGLEGPDSNPVSIQDIINSFKDPVALASFEVWSQTQNFVTKMFMAGKDGIVPEGFAVHGVGMAAAFMMSTIFTDFFADPDVKTCFKSRMMNVRHPGVPINEQACDNAYTTWAVHNKLVQYAPTLTSMVLTGYIQHLTKDAVKAAVESGAKLIIKGVRLVKPVSLASRELVIFSSATAASGPEGGFVAAAIDLGWFMFINNTIGPIISHAWDDFNIGTWNVKAHLEKWGAHKDFITPLDPQHPDFAIKDPYSVEMVTMRDAHDMLMELYQQMQATNWSEPTSPDTCMAGHTAPQDTSARTKSYNAKANALDKQADDMRKAYDADPTMKPGVNQLRDQAAAAQAQATLNDKAGKPVSGFLGHMWSGVLGVTANVVEYAGRTSQDLAKKATEIQTQANKDQKAGRETESKLGDLWATTVNTVAQIPSAVAFVERVGVRTAAAAYHFKFATETWVTNRIHNGKTDPELKCEMLHDPAGLLHQYSVVSHNWRDHLQKDFVSKMNKWQELVSGFIDEYRSFRKVAEYIATSKFNQVHKNAPRPDLSRDAINQIINSDAHYAGMGYDATHQSAIAQGVDLKDSFGVPRKTWDLIDQENEQARKENDSKKEQLAQAEDLNRRYGKPIDPALLPKSEKSNTPESESPDGMQYVPTPDWPEYVIAGLACGPQWQNGGKIDISQHLGNLFNWAWNHSFGGAPEYMSTPLGSSIKFIPPNMTTGPGYVCSAALPASTARMINPHDYRNQSLWQKTMNGYQGSTEEGLITGSNWIRQIFRQPGDAQRVFNGRWFDENGKAYENLAEYVYDNLDPAIWDSKGDVTLYSAWEDENIHKTIDPIWKHYEKTYEHFTEEKFTPILFDRSMHSGCWGDRQVKDPKTGKTKTVLATFSRQDYDDLGFINMIGENGKLGQAGIIHGTYQCADSAATAFRVSNGLLKSIEIEIRQYLRGMFSIYVTAHPPEKQAAARAKFIDRANKFIANYNFQHDPREAVEPASKDFDTLSSLIHESAADYRKDITQADGDFKNDMIDVLRNQVQRAQADWSAFGDVYDSLNWDKALSEPTAKKNNTTSSSPFDVRR